MKQRKDLDEFIDKFEQEKRVNSDGIIENTESRHKEIVEIKRDNVRASLDDVIHKSQDHIDPEAFKKAQELFNLESNEQRIERTYENYENEIKKPRQKALSDGNGKIIASVNNIMSEVGDQRQNFAQKQSFQTYVEEQQDMTLNSFLTGAALRNTNPADLVSQQNINGKANIEP